MATSGRNLVLKRDGTAIAGARSDGLTLTSEPIDITSKEDSGWKTLLANAGMRSFEGSIEGVTKDGALIAALLSADTTNLMFDGTVEILGLVEVEGDFYLTNLQKTGEQADAVTFSATISSSSPPSLVAVSPFPLGPLTVTGIAGEGETLTRVLPDYGGTTVQTTATRWQRLSPAGQWLDIPTETAATYLLAAADVGTFVRSAVVRSNSVGDHEIFSAPIGPIAP